MVVDLRAMLQQEADNWAMLGQPALLQRFVLRNGTLYKGSARPKGVRRGRAKECFSNSANAVLADPTLTYCEGIAVSSKLLFPIHHAWCARGETVLDLTWEDPADCTYLGVTLDQTQLVEQLLLSSVYGVLDTGRGLNAKFMFARDPELEVIVTEVMARPSTLNAL